jgi:hypothetical protein
LPAFLKSNCPVGAIKIETKDSFFVRKGSLPFFQFLFQNGVLSLLSTWGENIMNVMHNSPCNMFHLFL